MALGDHALRFLAVINVACPTGGETRLDRARSSGRDSRRAPLAMLLAGLVAVLGVTWGRDADAQINVLMARTTVDVTSTTDNTYSTVTGLTWYIAANTTYAFACRIAYDREFLGTEMFLSVNGPASPTNLRYAVTIPNDATGPINFGSQTAYDTHAAFEQGASSDAVPALPALIQGTIENGSTAGTFAIRFRSQTGSALAVTILRGSFCTVARQ